MPNSSCALCTASFAFSPVIVGISSKVLKAFSFRFTYPSRAFFVPSLTPSPNLRLSSSAFCAFLPASAKAKPNAPSPITTPPIVATIGFAIIAPIPKESSPSALTTPITAGANNNAVPYTFLELSSNPLNQSATPLIDSFNSGIACLAISKITLPSGSKAICSSLVTDFHCLALVS
ncbi:hypothetical protein B4153_6015 [Bacillus cereus]|nr:hypothetical protein B4153_6015 [Bacillus cereus]